MACGWGSRVGQRRAISAIPPGWDFASLISSGGVAALNHRLMSVTPAGVRPVGPQSRQLTVLGDA